MWPRYLEMVIGVWWIIAPLFTTSRIAAEHHIFFGLMMLGAASISFWGPFRKSHLLNAAIALAILIEIFYLYPFLPPIPVQMDLFSAWVLSMLALLPNHAFDPPDSWQRF
jgi:hypothetical protein